jgi:hypothetical protein
VDLAVSFVREDELTANERKAYKALEKEGRVIVRDRERPIANLRRLRPKAAAAQVEAAIPSKFRHASEFPAAWRTLKVRPPSSAKGTARRTTDERYCIYDDLHDDYGYTEAFIDLLIKKCRTEDGFREVVGRAPHAQVMCTSGYI